MKLSANDPNLKLLLNFPLLNFTKMAHYVGHFNFKGKNALRHLQLFGFRLLYFAGVCGV